MLDINVKTIDGQNRSYSVPDNYTVKQFKEKIASSLNIPVERQRLIFQGRELKDSSSLNEFDVDGKTLHLVQRVPPSQFTRQRANTDEPSSQSSTNANLPPNQNAPDVQQIIQQLIGGLGEFGQNATFNTTNNGDTNGMEVHIDLGNVSQIVNENEIRSRIRNIRRFLTMTEARLNRLREIQSGAPLDDTPNSTIIVGSIQTTTALTDGNNIIGFETNQQNIRGPIDPRLLSLAGLAEGASNAGQRVVTTSIPLSSLLSNLPSGNAPPPTTTPSSSTSNQPAADSQSQEQQEQQQAAQEQQSIGVEVLAEMTQSVMDAYARFMPYLQQYHTMLTNDQNEPPESPNSTASSSTNPQTAFNFRTDGAQNANITVLGGDNRRQRFCNNINDMMHLLGHLFHNLSDLHVNIRDRPPRQMHTMSSMSHATSTIIGAAVPVEATIQIPLQVPIPGSAPTSNSSTTTGVGAAGAGSNPIFLRRRPRSTQSFTSTTTTTTTRAPTTTTTSSTENSNTNTTNTNTTTTTTTTRTGPTRIQTPGAGIPFGLNSLSTNNSYDQYLPCNSVHFYNSYNPLQQQQVNNNNNNISQSQRRRHPAGDQSSQPTQETTTQQPQATPQNDISRLLSNILSSTLRGENNQEGNQHFRVNIGGVPGQISIATISTSSSSENTTPTTQTPTSTPLINSPRGSAANLLPNLSSMLFGGANNIFSNLTRNSTTAQSQPQDRVAGAILREAFNLMDTNNQNDQRLNQPLREFMRIFGSDELDEMVNNSRTGAPSMINIFNVFFSSLTLGDMIDLARGQNRHRVFQATREPLRQYIRGLIQPNNTPNSEDYQNLTDRLFTDIFEDSNGLNIDFSQFELVDENIDFKKSFEKLVKQNLRSILEHLFDSSYEQESSANTWSFVLFQKFQSLLDQVINLGRACVRNADTKMLQLVVEKLRTGLASGSSLNLGPLFGPFEGFIRNHVQEILNSVNTNRNLVENFIVYKIKEEPVKSNLSSDEDNKSIDSNQFDSASSTLSGHSMEIDQHFAEARQKLEDSIKPSTSNINSSLSSSNNNNSSDIPIEWLPVIERDIEAQKKFISENKERSFSDAYSSGMPAKKRKILSSKSDLLTENIFKRVLSRTLEQIQLKSNANEQNLVEESLNQSQLLESFNSELDSAITERLRNDSDFVTILNQQSSLKTEENEDSVEDLIYNKDRFAHSRRRLK